MAKHSYLIVEGQVLLQVTHNPITHIDYKARVGIEAHDVEDVHNTVTGKGNISLTINKAQVMCLGSGQWVGEEVVYAKMPIIYDAIIDSNMAKVLRINNSALKYVIQPED